VNVPGGQGLSYVVETAPGTYNLTLSCGSGVSAGTGHVVVTVPAPAVTISASPSIVPQDGGADITWNSSVAPCKLFDNSFNTFGTDVAPSGTTNIWERQTGTITYTIKCGTGNQLIQASTNVTVTTGNNPTTVASSVTNAVINTPVTLTWSSSGAGACNAAGGNGSDGWTGSKSASGSQTVTSPTVGTVTYTLNCGPTTSQTHVNYTAPGTTVDTGPTPTVTLSADKMSQTVGSQITLTWNAQNSDGCAASGGTNGDGWSGSLSPSGSMQIAESNAGAVTYEINCTGAPPAATAQVTVSFTAPAAQGGGKGGGGAMDTLTMMVMSGFLGMGIVRRRRPASAATPPSHAFSSPIPSLCAQFQP
jgi:hypothetical protein